MLERASTCLETGGRQLLRKSNRSLSSRRPLHSSIWHHSPSDHNVSNWWTAVSTLGYENGDVDHHDPSKHGRHSQPDGGLLFDFLYPAKTLALLKRISTVDSNTVRSRRKLQSHRNSIRHFSTTQWVSKEAVAEAINLAGDELEEGMRENMLRLSAPDALRELLSSGVQGMQDLAWRLYSAIPERSRAPHLQKELLDFLASAEDSIDATRVLQIFNALPIEHRGGTAYRIAVSAHLSLELIGSAVQLQEEAAARAVSIDIGTDQILQRIVQRNKWELSMRVCKAFLQCTQNRKFHIGHWLSAQSRKRGDHKLAWGTVSELPYLRGHLDSFLQYVEQYRHEWTSTIENQNALAFMLEGLAPEAMNQILDVHRADEDFIWKYFIGLFSKLDNLGLPSARLYKHAIGVFLSIPRYREYKNQRKVFMALYEQYREKCIASTNPRDRPSWELLRKLILQAGHHGSHTARSAGIDNLLNDTSIFYPNERLPKEILRYLLMFHAEHGEVSKVHRYFDALPFQSTDQGLKSLSSLIFAYARRADVQGAETQFKRISQEFGLEPDVGCWNVLLLAYARADDLDGAIDCFNRILDAGVAPDVKTFGPLLDLCAARGDVEAFESIHSKAEQLKVPVRTNIRARAGYVHASLSSGDAEGAEIIARTMLEEQRAGSLKGDLTHVWNLLINHHALLGDVPSSRRLYREMLDKSIPLDTWTYGALMRSLIEVKQTNAAYKILRVTMPQNNIRVHAFHYSLVIAGFIRERQFHRALHAHRRMIGRNVPQTPSSRLSSLHALGMAELEKLAELKDGEKRERLIEVETSLREVLLNDSESEVARREPRHQRFVDSRAHNVPDGYFGLLILLYNTRGAYEICKELFEAASMAKTDDNGYEAPIGLLVAIMEAHLRAGEHDEVAKCFHLARRQADKLVKTLAQVVEPAGPTVQFSSLLDPAVRDKMENPTISRSRRHVLHRATLIYMRSLFMQKTEAAFKQAQRTIRSLLTSGYILDNLTWNEFILALAQRGHNLEAFATCEAYLIPAFPGWRRLSPYYMRRELRGYSWMDIRRAEVDRKTIMPRYRTLVVLAASYAKARRDQDNGIGYDPDQGGWPRETLEKLAPKTVDAIRTMPRTGDKVQKEFLSGLE
ncbi:TPR-like protein [Aaosphaeria arxii CBS 175.79]|uniref:TPR-like protein n=1 Tax=Aaosphaeria arxii CBS 175.79 TaxID=1450172 RepID=A0A6A5XC22_9PLEO|nr:TPR-like protein [Aaosphaeria arxii CBS 175.79]KAF2010459.1 TPR-like protein [Aaosphaeria arxii CBS 175.79]